MAILVAFYIRWRDQDRINSDAHAVQLFVNTSPEIRVSSLFDDEQIDVTVPRHRASGGRPEEYNPLRLCHFHDTLNDVV